MPGIIERPRASEEPRAIARSGAAAAGTLDVVRAALRSGLTGPHAEALRAAQREVVLGRTVVLIWISVFVMPTAIWSYVYFLSRPQLRLAVLIVLGAIGLVLLHRTLIARGLFDRHYQLAMLLLVGGVFGPTGTAIVEITRHGAGDFLFAFYLIYFAFTALFPAEMGWILLTAAMVATSYVGGRLFRPEGLVFDADLIQKLIYFAELTFIGTVLNRVVYGLFIDERRARIDLAAANAGLRELDKAKSSFFSNVSHEIRTPLTLILTPITHILQADRARLPPGLVEKLEGVRGNASRLLKMVNSLLDFAKVEAGQAQVTLSEIELDDLVRYVGGLFGASAENRGITLDMRAEAAGLRIQTDVDKLEKILVNLTGNALKFTPQGGRITLRSARSGDDYTIAVSDTGVGIAPEDHAKVFQRFTQIQNASQVSVKGTGIGLSMVQEYARLLGGGVSLESELGAGATFTVTLPIRGPKGATRAQGPVTRTESAEIATADVVSVERKGEGVRSIEKAGPGSPRILVVDDNPALVHLISSILENDYNLYLAFNGREALARIAAEPVDLVVSDVMMPEIDGLELVRRLRADERTKHIPVVLLTARGATVEKIEGLDTGADDYIGKPFDPEELRARIRSLFELRKLTKSLAEKSAALTEALSKLREEQLKVIESEKLRTLGELAAGIFHELHNYMNIICNGAVPLKETVEALRHASGGGAQVEEDMDSLEELAGIIVDAARAAGGVTSELKAYAYQDDKGATAPVDLNGLIRSAVRLFGKTGTAGQVELSLCAQPLVVRAVSTRLTQVFTNLVKNGFEAMGPGGKVVIETRIDEGRAIATVTDSGPGVPVEHRRKLFEPFHTTKKQGQGLGLGLSLSRKVMHDLNGDLRYDESHEGGARFVLTLPLERESART